MATKPASGNEILYFDDARRLYQKEMGIAYLPAITLRKWIAAGKRSGGRIGIVPNRTPLGHYWWTPDMIRRDVAKMKAGGDGEWTHWKNRPAKRGNTK